MRALIALLLSLWFAPAWAQLPMTGAGKGAPSSYQGLGDAVVASGGIVKAYWYCGRAVTAAYAASAGSGCVVQRTSDNATCTTKFAVTGKIDLLTAYCSSNTETISQFCNATTCGVSSEINQVNPGTYDKSAASQATQPVFTLSQINGLPVAVYTAASSHMLASGSLTQGAPFILASVFKRTSVVAGGYLSASGTTLETRGSSLANTAVVSCNTNVGITAPDNAWHGLSMLCSGVANTGAYKIDNGTTQTGQTMGAGVLTAQIMWSGKSSASYFLTGQIAETAVIDVSGGTASAIMDAIYTNQSSANGFNSAF